MDTPGTPAQQPVRSQPRTSDAPRTSEERPNPGDPGPEVPAPRPEGEPLSDPKVPLEGV